MPVPADPTEKRAQSHRAFIDSIKTAEFAPKPAAPVAAPAPQLIIAWTAGGLVVEAPGQGGAARTKVEGVTFDDLPAALQATLIVQKDRIDGETARQNAIRQRERHQTPAERPVHEVEARKRSDEIAAERFARWDRWINSLPESERAFHIAKREAAQTRRAELEAENSRQLWMMTALNHSVDLANRVILDPKRRGRIAARVNKSPSGKSKPRSTKGLTGGRALKLDL